MSEDLQNDLKQLQERIGYRFKNLQLLQTALTHSSYANEQEAGVEHNERMEFLGDSVLGVIISEILYLRNEEPEGVLTNLKIHLVNAKMLHSLADELELGNYLLLGKGEEKSAGRHKKSVLENAFEALVAAVFLDGGYEAAQTFVERIYGDKIDQYKHETLRRRDYKTYLQETVQAAGLEPPEYETLSSSGPDHEKHFKVCVKLEGNPLAEGQGRSKKAAEQDAARVLLMQIEDESVDISSVSKISGKD